MHCLIDMGTIVMRYIQTTGHTTTYTTIAYGYRQLESSLQQSGFRALLYVTVGGVAVTSSLGVCGFVRWQAGDLDKKFDEKFDEQNKKFDGLRQQFN